MYSPTTENTMNTPTLYTVRASITGQPSIECDDIALYKLAEKHATIVEYPDSFGRTMRTGTPHKWYGNDGERTLSGITDRDGFAAAVKATGARTRKLKGDRVKVLPAVELLEAVALLEAAWQAMAAKGTSHQDMRHVMINHPTYTAQPKRWA